MRRRAWKRLFRFPDHPEQIERDLDDEIAFHLACRAEDIAEQRDLDLDTARALARERFGDVGQVRADCSRIARSHQRRRRLGESLES